MCMSYIYHIYIIFKHATLFFTSLTWVKSLSLAYSVFFCVELLQIHLISRPQFTYQNRCGRGCYLWIYIVFSIINFLYHLPISTYISTPTSTFPVGICVNNVLPSWLDIVKILFTSHQELSMQQCLLCKMALDADNIFKFF